MTRTVDPLEDLALLAISHEWVWIAPHDYEGYPRPEADVIIPGETFHRPRMEGPVPALADDIAACGFRPRFDVLYLFDREVAALVARPCGNCYRELRGRWRGDTDA